MLGNHEAANAELAERKSDAKKLRRWQRVRKVAPWVAIIGLAVGLAAAIIRPVANDDTEKANRAAAMVQELQRELERRDITRGEIEHELAETKRLLTTTQAQQNARIAALEAELRALGVDPAPPVVGPRGEPGRPGPTTAPEPAPTRTVGPARTVTSRPTPTRDPDPVCTLLPVLCP